MKFLLFNVAVAAALVFLFTADRGEIQKIAGRVHDAAGEMKAYAAKTLNRGQAKPDRGRVPPPGRSLAAPAERSAEPEQTTPPPKPPVTLRAVAPEPRPEPPLPPQLARNLPPMPEVDEEPPPAPPAAPSAASPAGLDPAVAKRRQEILEGLDTADATPAVRAPVLKEGARLMSPAERRRELLSLAEEMELLYARSISQ